MNLVWCPREGQVCQRKQGCPHCSGSRGTKQYTHINVYPQKLSLWSLPWTYYAMTVDGEQDLVDFLLFIHNTNIIHIFLFFPTLPNSCFMFSSILFVIALSVHFKICFFSNWFKYSENISFQVSFPFLPITYNVSILFFYCWRFFFFIF